MDITHVVVDGSNLATEGRTLPSLKQLEEAIAAYELEHPDATLVVVVDATFEHRIEAPERDRLKEAELHGEVVSPPAGPVGRGDAFVLKIAERTGGIVLSNDSFQEFHGDHPWLFEEGRLVGGKPVPGVGWIFTPRTPVRGPKSRQATSSAARKKASQAAPAKKLAVKRPDGSTPKVGDTLTPLPPPEPKKVRAYELAKELGIDNKALLALAKKAKVAVRSHSSSIEPDDATKIREVLATQAATAKVRAYELAKELGIDNKALLALAKKAKVAVASHSSAILLSDAEKIKTQAAAAVAVQEAAAAPDGSEKKGRQRSRSRGGRGKATSEQAPEPAKTEEAATKRPRRRGSRTGGQQAAEPVNAPLDLVAFVSTYEVGGQVDGVVTSFTSHGAMVDVALSGDSNFTCYVRTENLGTPPPTKARDVLTKGDQRRYKILSVDTARRTAELELV